MSYTDQEIRDALETVPHAGGEEYTESMGKLHPGNADTTVSTRSELVEAVDSSAEVIAIDSNIYMGETEIDIGDKTIVGDRGWDGSEGPLVYTDQRGYTSNGIADRPHTVFYSSSTGSSPRVTGIRIRGARWDEDFTRWDYDENLSRGITLMGDAGEVDNCEIYGFTWNDVHIRGDYDADRFTEAEVHHCHLHKSYQLGYGYGVSHWRGVGHVHHNYFNEQRHAIDGYGYVGSGYTAEENVFGPTQYSHTVDMHCLTENHCDHSGDDPSAVDYGLRAGTRMDIRHNTFCFRYDVNDNEEQGVNIRGEPYDYVTVESNRFMHPERPPENSGNDRDYAWTQQNVHGVYNGKCDIDYDAIVADGEYTDEWTATNNQFGAPDEPHDGRGASVDIKNPDNSVGSGGDWYEFPRKRLKEVHTVLTEEN